MSSADPLPPDASYRPLPTLPLDVVRRNDEAAKPAVMRRQQNLLNERLQKASGKDFDVAYIASQVQDHQRTANLLQWHISSGQNEA